MESGKSASDRIGQVTVQAGLFRAILKAFRFLKRGGNAPTLEGEGHGGGNQAFASLAVPRGN